MIGMLWAAGLALFFLPWSKGAWMPAVGLTISFAVLWLFKTFFSQPLPAGFQTANSYAAHPRRLSDWPGV